MLAEINNGKAGELGPVIGYDLSWEAKTTYYFLPIELPDPFCCDLGNCLSFDPFGEVVHAYYKKF